MVPATATLAHRAECVVGQLGRGAMICWVFAAAGGHPDDVQMRWLTCLLLASCILCASSSTATAQQNLSVSLFEKYVDSLREEAGIPSVAAAITQDGNIVWQRGFGRPNLDSTQPATLDTPYLIGGLSQTLGSTLVLRKCVDQGYATP